MPDLAKLHNLAGALREKSKQARPTGSGTRWYDIRAAAAPDTTAVYLFSMIGEDPWGEGTSAATFVTELRGIATGRIELHISSEGGSVFDGLAMYESLKQHPAYVDVVIDSLAASAASVVAMSGDRVRMARNARMMVHDAALGGAFGAGTAADMRDFAQAVTEMADLLDDISLNIADIYSQKAGGTPEEWRSRMCAGAANGGTWFSARDAKDIGLIDGIMGEEEDVPEATASGETVDLTALMAAIEGAFSRG